LLADCETIKCGTSGWWAEPTKCRGGKWRDQLTGRDGIGELVQVAGRDRKGPSGGK
ncbi:unnamed protein product, partial [Allacma fusca]